MTSGNGSFKLPTAKASLLLTETSFSRLCDSNFDELTSRDFFQQVDSEETCNLALLLRAIKSNVIGSF